MLLQFAAVLMLATVRPLRPRSCRQEKARGSHRTAAAKASGLRYPQDCLAQSPGDRPHQVLEIYTGQPIDWSAFDKSKEKSKQKWMDRLAGNQPQADQVDLNKIPYQLIRTYGVAVDSKGNIYAADQGVDAIFIFNPETKTAEMIRNGKEARFGLINGLAMDDNDRLFVTDDKLHEVLVFNTKHEEEAAFGADVLGNPGGIVIDTENRFLYVVDTLNDVVDVFDADTFKLLRKIGTPGKKHQLTDPGTFSLPTNVALDSDGNVYVTDTLNARVEMFDADGAFIGRSASAAMGRRSLTAPRESRSMATAISGWSMPDRTGSRSSTRPGNFSFTSGRLDSSPASLPRPTESRLIRTIA